MGGWVAPKASSGAEKKKKTLSFSETEERAPERSDHNIIIITRESQPKTLKCDKNSKHSSIVF
jgi:hypothetical protein